MTEVALRLLPCMLAWNLQPHAWYTILACQSPIVVS